MREMDFGDLEYICEAGTQRRSWSEDSFSRPTSNAQYQRFTYHKNRKGIFDTYMR